MPKIVDHAQRRQTIVDAMWRVVARDGFDAVSVRAVAAEAGMSKSTIAHYFTTRDEVLAIAVAQQIEGNLRKLAQLKTTSCTPDVAVEAIMLAIPVTAIQRRNSQAWLALLEGSHTNPAAARTLADLNTQVRAAVESLLHSLAQNGYVDTGRTIAAEAVKIHALIDGLSLQSLTAKDLMSRELVVSIVALVVGDLQSAPVVASK